MAPPKRLTRTPCLERVMRSTATWIAVVLFLPASAAVDPSAEPAQYILEGSLRWGEPATFTGAVTLSPDAGPATLLLREEQVIVASSPVPGVDLPVDSPIMFMKQANSFERQSLIRTAERVSLVLHRWVDSGTGPPTYEARPSFFTNAELYVVGHISPPQAVLSFSPQAGSTLRLANVGCGFTNPEEQTAFPFPQDGSSIDDGSFQQAGLGLGQLRADCGTGEAHVERPARVLLYGYDLDLEAAGSTPFRTGTYKESRNETFEGPASGPPTPIIKTVTQILEIQYADRPLSLVFGSASGLELYSPVFGAAGTLGIPPSTGHLTWGDLHWEGTVPAWTGEGGFVLGWTPEQFTSLGGLTTATPPVPGPVHPDPRPPVPELPTTQEPAPAPPVDPPYVVPPIRESATEAPVATTNLEPVAAPPTPLVDLFVQDGDAKRDGSDQAVVIVKRTGADLSQTLTVFYSLESEGGLRQASASILAGEESVTVRVPGGDVGGPEAATVTFTIIDDPHYMRSDPYTASLAIVDVSSPAIPVWLAVGGGLAIVVAGLLAGLFSRLQRHKMLDHPRRAQIYEFVRQQPGVEMNTVSKALQMPWARLAHHLATLERGQYVRLHKIGGRTALFPANEGYGGREARLAQLRRPAAARVLQILQSHPGADQDMLTSALRLSQPRVSRLLRTMGQVGLVKVRRSERRLQYFHADAATLASDPTYARNLLNPL